MTFSGNNKNFFSYIFGIYLFKNKLMKITQNFILYRKIFFGLETLFIESLNYYNALKENSSFLSKELYLFISLIFAIFFTSVFIIS